jgi:hypothetical protein
METNMAKGPTNFHVIMLALNVLVRDESRELVMKMFKEQNISNPEKSYIQVTEMAKDQLEKFQ